MMTGDGRVGVADQALAVPATPAGAVDGPTGFDPSRIAEELSNLIARCESAKGADRKLDADICRLVDLPECVPPDGYPEVLEGIIERVKRGDYADDPDVPFRTGSVDAALTLLPKGADWRRLTHRSASTYAANPYNPKAQKRIDGFGSTVPLQLCSAALRLRLAHIVKAIATEARRAETSSGSVHEGAGPQDIAQTPPGSDQ